MIFFKNFYSVWFKLIVSNSFFDKCLIFFNIYFIFIVIIDVLDMFFDIIFVSVYNVYFIDI